MHCMILWSWILYSCSVSTHARREGTLLPIMRFALVTHESNGSPLTSLSSCWCRRDCVRVRNKAREFECAMLASGIQPSDF